MVRNDGDNKIIDSEIRVCGVAGSLIRLKMTGPAQTAGDLVIAGNHTYTGWPGGATVSGNII